MPFMGGAELVHEIRRIDPGAAAMVITAHVADDAIEAARREGLLAVLPKPVAVRRLLELLAAARRDGLVAVVEDDPRMSDNLCEALRGRGFAAVTAASVLETERLGPVEPFCALVDLRVPGGPDGEAMRRLREQVPGAAGDRRDRRPARSPPSSRTRATSRSRSTRASCSPQSSALHRERGEAVTPG